MRILLDECLPRGLRSLFPGHDVRTVPEQGWAGLENGELLRRAEPVFDVFVTADQNLPYQQTLAGSTLRVLVLAGRSNRLADLAPLIPTAVRSLSEIHPGEVRRIAG